MHYRSIVSLPPGPLWQDHEVLLRQGVYTSFIRSSYHHHEQHQQRKNWVSCSLRSCIQFGASGARGMPSTNLSAARYSMEVSPLRLSPNSRALYLDWSEITKSKSNSIKKSPRTSPTKNSYLVNTRSIGAHAFVMGARTRGRGEERHVHKELVSVVYALWATSQLPDY